MKHTWKKMICMVSALLMTGCTNQGTSSEVTVETTAPPVTTVVTTTTVPVTQTTPAPIPSGVNPLTGESGYREEAIGKRPVAVMVNNIRDALPQYGIAQADIIYEMLVEGGITRLMAVYADYGSMPNICSVRSCRYYYPIVALGMDAIYCHWGMDQTIAKDTLNRLRIDHLDGGGNGWQLCFFRDTERMMHYASEHTGFLKGSKIPDAIEQYGFRTETDHGNAFCFHDPKELVSSGEPCHEAVAHFSYAYWSTFDYDETNHVYLKQHSGNPHMDSATGTQLSFTNLFFLQTDIGLRDNQYLVDIALQGGSGYYVSAGSYQKIRWEKTAESEPIRVYEEDGDELQVNAGKSYIGFIDYDYRLELKE